MLFDAVIFGRGTDKGHRARADAAFFPGLDLTSLDKSVDPCVDFYHYACGGWQKNNPILADQTSWDVYAKLYQDNLNFLRGVLEQAAKVDGQRNGATQKTGDFYWSCMAFLLFRAGMTHISWPIGRATFYTH